jgi:hypothetical protein
MQKIVPAHRRFKESIMKKYALYALALAAVVTLPLAAQTKDASTAPAAPMATAAPATTAPAATAAPKATTATKAAAPAATAVKKAAPVAAAKKSFVGVIDVFTPADATKKTAASITVKMNDKPVVIMLPASLQVKDAQGKLEPQTALKAMEKVQVAYVVQKGTDVATSVAIVN